MGRLGLVAALLAIAVVCCLPQVAWADELALSGEGSWSLAAVDVVPLPVECSPESIQTGVSCGMTEMCGQDPCLCGAVDEWGVCACNGTQETRPAWALSLGGDAGRTVHLLPFGGRTYVVSLGWGGASAAGVLSASLAHYGSASLPVHVEVAPFGVLDLLKVVVALATIAGVFAAIAAGLRVLVGRVGRIARARRRCGGGREESRSAPVEGPGTDTEVQE